MNVRGHTDTKINVQEPYGYGNKRSGPYGYGTETKKWQKFHHWSRLNKNTQPPLLKPDFNALHTPQPDLHLSLELVDIGQYGRYFAHNGTYTGQ